MDLFDTTAMRLTMYLQIHPNAAMKPRLQRGSQPHRCRYPYVLFW
jgi:hypothetical protein